VKLLSEKKIEAYTPIVKTMRQWSDRKKLVEIPLLNGYVFVNSSSSNDEKILQTRGVVSFVRNDGRHAIIRDVEINRLRQLVEIGYQLEVASISNRYADGDKIKIMSGSLKGIEGFVVQDNGQKTLEVILESTGHSIKVRLPKGIVIGL
jgi:transcription antitermination factor NusG